MQGVPPIWKKNFKIFTKMKLNFSQFLKLFQGEISTLETQFLYWKTKPLIFSVSVKSTLQNHIFPHKI